MDEDLRSTLEKSRHDPRALERLYRTAKDDGKDAQFNDAIATLAVADPDDVLLQAWAARLDIAIGGELSAEAKEPFARRRWFVAIPVSVMLGVAYVLLPTKSELAIPGPDIITSPAFLLGWAPLTAAAVLLFCLLVRPDKRRMALFGGALVLLGILFGLAAWKGWAPLATMFTASGGASRPTDTDAAILIVLHLPFACWAVLTAALCATLPDLWRQIYGLVLKSAETIVTVGVYLIAGVVFTGLTYGIFSVLGVDIPGRLMARFVSWGMGVVPVLALATVYDPARSPADQSWQTGLARVIRILVRLLLPLTLGVLLVYVAYFIPTNFMQAFKQRETLIVYNMTIIAIIAVLAAAAPGLDERLPERQSQILRYGIIALGILTFLLNCYAFAAIVWRALGDGYTPNRHAVIGWNVTTLLMLASLMLRQALARGRPWADIFGRSMAQALVLAAAWATWIVVGLPHF